MAVIGRQMTSKPGRVLALASVGSFMIGLDIQVVATALSTIHRDLGASIESLEWTVNAYNLTFAVLLTGAALGDRFGRRRMFVAGLGLFVLASAACALSPTIGAVIAARAVQGAGAALVLPLALTLLSAAFPPARRGRALGMFAGVQGLATFSGPFIGGAVAQGLAWQWIFWINVPVGVIAILLAQYLQNALGYGPLGAGLRLMPWTGTLMACAPIAGMLADRLGERRFMVGGLVLQTIGMSWLALIARTDLAYSPMLLPLIISGCGISMAMPAAQKSVVGAVKVEEIGQASGAITTLRIFGGVFGIAILTAVFAGAGSYASPRAFTEGFAPAMGVAAALPLIGAIAGLGMPGRPKPSEMASMQLVPAPEAGAGSRGDAGNPSHNPSSREKSLAAHKNIT